MPRVLPASGLVGSLVLMLTIGIHASTLAARPPVDLYTKAALEELRRAATAGRDGEHLARLFALRQLHDPALRPLFQRLRSREDWTLQVHGSLGLAELATPPRLDPAFLSGLDPDAATTLIATALNLSLTDGPIRRTLVDRDDLPPLARLQLVTRIVTDDGDSARDAARRAVLTISELIDPDDPRVGLLVTCLARQLQLELPGDRPGIARQLADDPNRPGGERATRERRGLELWLLDEVRLGHFDAMMPWVESVLSNPETRRATRTRALMTALELDPDAGHAAWDRLLGPAPRYADRIRFALLMMMTGRPMPPSAAVRLSRGLPDDDEVVRAILALDQARRKNLAIAPVLIQLLDLHHPATTEWILSELEDAAPDVAIPVCRHLIKNGLSGTPTPSTVELAVLATNRLFELAPEEVLRRLVAVEDDVPGQEILLLGLFDHLDPAIGTTCAALPRSGAGRADSLALLLMARSADKLSADDQRRLGMIAAGGGRISAGLRTQAAWLYLQHIGAAPDAIRVVSADSP